MAPRPSRRRPIRVQVDTDRVEGKIELSDIITRLHRNALNEPAGRAATPTCPTRWPRASRMWVSSLGSSRPN